jgi:hypothetical protein
MKNAASRKSLSTVAIVMQKLQAVLLLWCREGLPDPGGDLDLQHCHFHDAILWLGRIRGRWAPHHVRL